MRDFAVRVFGALETPSGAAGSPSALNRGNYARLPIQFEDLLAQLERFPRLFIELDGSFLWSGPSAEATDAEVKANSSPVRAELAFMNDRAATPWSLEGMIYDDTESVRYLELKGKCPRDAWLLLVASLNAVPEELSIELLGESQVVSGKWFLDNYWPDSPCGVP